MHELKDIVESDKLYCPKAGKLVDLSQSRAECAKKHGCVGSCLLNVEFYLKATARYLGWCK
ncbi:MAG TPA: hypothetical protein VFU31_24865 [Candidatus Binatia bacterium]|nr:hypothetical protein [Candidatus Binatia bacterium]